MRCRHSRIVITTSFISVSFLAFISVAKMSPRFVWNMSKSAPTGMYKIENRTLQIGDFLLIEPEESVAEIIENRAYLPPDTPLIKRFFADAGAEICREKTHIFVNKLHVADALLVDSSNRKMPEWRGCFTLQSDEIFLLNEHHQSLDGRYFGATEKSQVIGVAVPVFIWETSG